MTWMGFLLHWPLSYPYLVQVIHGLLDRIMEVLGVALQGTDEGRARPTFSIAPSQVNPHFWAADCPTAKPATNCIASRIPAVTR